MNRFFRRALPLLSAAALVTFGAPTPAAAHADVCTGMFFLSSGSGLGAPVIASTNATIVISSSTSACASGASFTAAASFTGSCALATGSGMTNTGHSFSFQLASTMVFTGQVTGTLNVVEDFTDSGSCLSGSASGFFLTGSVALTH